MNNIIQFLQKLFGTSAIATDVEEITIEALAAQGLPAVTAAVTLPQSTINEICTKFGTDPTTVEAANVAHAQAFAAFVLAATVK